MSEATKALKSMDEHVKTAKTKLDEVIKTIRDEANAATKVARKEVIEAETDEAKAVRIRSVRALIYKKAEADPKIRAARHEFKRWTRRLAKAKVVYKRVQKKVVEVKKEA